MPLPVGLPEGVVGAGRAQGQVEEVGVGQDLVGQAAEAAQLGEQSRVVGAVDGAGADTVRRRHAGDDEADGARPAAWSLSATS